MSSRRQEDDFLPTLVFEALFGPFTTEDVAEDEAETVEEARKGNTLPLISHLCDRPPTPLRDYILDILEHTIKRVPKPRRHVVEAQNTYSELAKFSGICERVGMNPTEAVRKTQDHFGLDDDKQVWRARKRYPRYRNPRYVDRLIEAERLLEELQRGDINGEVYKLISDAVRRHPELVDSVAPQSSARTASEPLAGGTPGTPPAGSDAG